MALCASLAQGIKRQHKNGWKSTNHSANFQATHCIDNKMASSPDVV